jgi:hypothetical protein
MAFQRSALAAVFWRAVRLSLPLTLAACGPSRVTPLPAPQRDCTQQANCGAITSTVQVKTDLPSGTVPEPFECDEACRPILCPSQAKSCVVTQRPEGAAVTCTALNPDRLGCPVPGRPVTEWAHEARACFTAHEVFAQMSVAEAESVAEFERLAVELELHDAPASLVARARRAALEERRHATVTAALVGIATPEFPLPPAGVRSLAQLAKSNLLEGCINETMSAVLIASQAQNALEADTRARLASVAADEFSHAEFSWDLHEWLVARLDAEDRRALALMGAERVALTLSKPVQTLPEDARAEVGLPSELAARAQAEVLAEEVWRPALAALC